MKKKILAVLLSLSSLPVFASQYYVVIPVPNHTAAASQNVNVALAGYALPGGLLGQSYSGFDFRTLLSVTGDAGYTGYGVHWSLAGGSLPAGLTLNSDGTLSGTPTVAGSSSFQVMASYKTKAGQQAYQVLVGNLTVSLAGGAPPQALVGQSFGYDLKPLLSVTGDSAYAGNGAGVTWTVVNSTLPAGLYLTSDGWIGGTPTASGSGSLTARATYKGIDGQQTYQIVSLAISVALGPATLPAGKQGSNYSFDLKSLLNVSGDTAYSSAGVTWSIASGSLPAGLSLGTDGVISGTPTAENAGSPFVIQATYRAVSGQQSYAVLVGAITVSLSGATIPTLTAGTVMTAYDLKPNLVISGDAAYSGDGSGVSWNVSGALPTGLTLGTDGRITGTPTKVGASSFAVTAGYKSKSSTPATYNMSVNANIVSNGSTRTWSDGTYAANCQSYLNPTGSYLYAGATGSGVYRISPAGTPMDVYCDMVNDGGGWTLLMKQANGDGTTLQGDTTYWTNGTTLNDNVANMNTNDGNFVSAAFSALSTTQLKLQASNESTTQLHATGGLTAKAAFSNANTASYADPYATPGTTVNWFVHATTYPNGDAITQARFGFNIMELYLGNPYCGARWGWSANQDPSSGYATGSNDACGGLGAYGPQYGSSFMNLSKNVWQPGTLYLWAK